MPETPGVCVTLTACSFMDRLLCVEYGHRFMDRLLCVKYGYRDYGKSNEEVGPERVPFQ